MDNTENLRESSINHKDDSLPRSSCSIEKNPGYSKRNVKFNENDPFICQKSQKLIPGKGGSKGYSDRYLPVRKMPKSSKDLYNDQTQWAKPDEDQLISADDHNKGLSLADIYKMELLGGQPDKALKESVIETYTNSNLLKFSNKEELLGREKDTRHEMFSRKFTLHIPEQYLPTPAKKDRKINKVPAKVLDAPALYDDFYLNLVDWSDSNILAVGLSNSVYLWNANTAKVARLMELNSNDLVTSTSWSHSTNILAVGTHSGEVQLWDAVKSTKISTFEGHSARVGAVSWNSNQIFASGSRDKSILVRDARAKDDCMIKMTGHRQQVCGLKWSFDQQQLASGGNDNRLNIWNMHSTSPVYSLLKHSAAVKALAWSPHQHGLLVSGGGTADRTIRFWNAVSGEETNCLNVGSQVCNLMFSKTVNQLVSTHGYSLNEINIWKMPKMQKIQTLTGHTYRVLYLAMSPDGTTIVTGAGDETLRFWNVFPKKEKIVGYQSQLIPDSLKLR